MSGITVVPTDGQLQIITHGDSGIVVNKPGHRYYSLGGLGDKLLLPETQWLELVEWSGA